MKKQSTYYITDECRKELSLAIQEMRDEQREAQTSNN